MHQNLLVSETEIKSHILEVANLINKDYKDKEITALVILKGGAWFAIDLLKYVTAPCEIEFIQASSYGNNTKSEDVVVFSHFDLEILRQKDVLIIDDILDTGYTISLLLKRVSEIVRSVKACCLLDKISRREVPVALDYPSIVVPNVWTFGYGMDSKGKFRNLPEIRYTT
jgi:hypoxanthine phosphoribosyltransferase